MSTQPMGAAQFPSEEHRKDLLQASKTPAGYDWNKLTEFDRWRLHAYDYGWRRYFICDYKAASPIDVHGDWYNKALADEVESMWRRR